MPAKKTPAKKPEPKPRAKRVVAPKVDLVSYSIKMVIPTGEYANIQPEIIVKAKTVEEAHDYIAPHMNKLWKEYYLINDRVVTKANIAKTTYEVETPAVSGVNGPSGNLGASSPVSSVALEKATQAINSCMSLDAFKLIENQVNISTKLTDEDKTKLIPLMAEKYEELGGK